MSSCENKSTDDHRITEDIPTKANIGDRIQLSPLKAHNLLPGIEEPLQCRMHDLAGKVGSRIEKSLRGNYPLVA